MQQKKETFQVIIDVIKNSTCFKAFTITTEVPEIFMQQFWYTIKKILDICPRVEGEEFTEVQDDDATLTFLIDLGYKGPLHKYTNMYVDHMHQPWRTLAAIINKCLSGKTASNDRLRKSRIDILWGMFYRENVDYPELIWEDFAFQIDHRKERKSRRETMPFPRFTKVIINHFLSQHKSLSNLKFQHYHTIKDDGIVSRLKFVRIGEDYQEYGLPIPDMMLNDAIKRSESYQMFLKYSTGQIPPKKSRGKGSQGKKTTDTPVADVDVSEESDSEPARKRTASRRVVKKKVTISAADNIIPDLDVALELGKSINLTEAAEEEAARQVHATHARIVTESVPKPARRRTSGIAFRDTSQVSKKVSFDPSQKLKGTEGSSEGTGRILGVPDESIVVFATSSKGTGTKPGVPDEEKVTFEENVILEWGSEQESEYSEEDQGEDEEVDWIDSDEDKDKKDDTDDDKSIDLEMTDDEETDDEFVQGVGQVNDDEDEEMTNTEVEESGKGDAKISDVAKEDAERIDEIKDDAKKAELPPTSSSLFVFLGFGVQILKTSSDTSLVGIVKDTTDAEINSLLDIKIQSEVPHIQTPSVLTIPVLVISDPSVLTPIHVTPSVAPATTLLTPSSVSTIPPVPHQTTAPIPTSPITTDAPTITTDVPESNALSALQLRVAKLEKDRHTADLIQKYSVKPALESSKILTPTIDLEQESEKSSLEIHKIKKEQAKKQKMPKYTIKSTDKATLKEYDQKSVLYQTMHKNKSFNRNPANHALYHALMKTLREDENVIDKGVTNTVKNHKRQHDDNDDDDDKDPSAGPNQGKKTKRRRTKESESSKKPSTTKETPKGKASSKGSKTGKSASTKEQVEEPIVEVEMDDVKMCFNALTDKLDWNILEGHRDPFDLSRPLPLQGRAGHLTVAIDYFFNNDLEYLKTSDPEKTYTTSITKSKAARYEIVGIEDMTPTLWSTIKHAYDKDAEKGIKHWGERRKLCVKKLHEYDNLEEIVVKRADRQLYKFKEGDFVYLYLNDIEDMLILAVQHKLLHLNESDIVDFIVALRMFIRSLIIKRRVEDLQLGVESYQKKLNITAPQQTFPEKEFKELYTPSYKPPGVIYEDLNKQKRVMRADELYKFSDG
ncbi:hypothetical protein Tco_1112963, partial [Tanacetum coccineum]